MQDGTRKLSLKSLASGQGCVLTLNIKSPVWLLQVPRAGCAWTTANRVPPGADGIVLMSHSSSNAAAACALQVNNLVGKPIVLYGGRSLISGASNAALDRARIIYETDWQVISKHAAPHSSILELAALTPPRPKLVLSQQDARTLEFSLDGAFFGAHATPQASCATTMCAVHASWLQALAANSGRGAAELLAFATEHLSRSAAGLCTRPDYRAGVLGMQSMQRVAAVELGMIKFASADLDLAYILPSNK